MKLPNFMQKTVLTFIVYQFFSANGYKNPILECRILIISLFLCSVNMIRIFGYGLSVKITKAVNAEACIKSPYYCLIVVCIIIVMKFYFILNRKYACKREG